MSVEGDREEDSRIDVTGRTERRFGEACLRALSSAAHLCCVPLVILTGPTLCSMDSAGH